MLKAALVAVILFFFLPAISKTECNGPKSNQFIYPVLGLQIKNPRENIIDPRSNGWYIANAFGDSCIKCSGSPEYPFHPGEDWNRVDGKDCNNPVYAIADGILIRKTKVSGDRGWFLIISHCLPWKINLAPLRLQNTIGKDSTEIVSSLYGHLADPTTKEEGQVIRMGEMIGKIKPDLKGGSHLHLEIRSNNNSSTADPPPANYNGYYKTKQSITNFGYINPSLFLTNVVSKIPILQPPQNLRIVINNNDPFSEIRVANKK
jgi:murein DD-endopeptidase MepM/ murein hydrolase activator NlpD